MTFDALVAAEVARALARYGGAAPAVEASARAALVKALATFDPARGKVTAHVRAVVRKAACRAANKSAPR